jgi:hypothetical protein
MKYDLYNTGNGSRNAPLGTPFTAGQNNLSTLTHKLKKKYE